MTLNPLDVLRPAGGDVTRPGAAIAVVNQALAEQPVLAGLDPREQLLAAAWLLTYRSARTRRAYASDFITWQTWLTARDLDVLAARRVHVDLWVSQQQAAASTVARRLSALAGFYSYAAAHDLVSGNPVVGVARPTVDPDHTTTVSLDRAQARALLAAADADHGRQQLRTAAIVRLLLHNGLRVDELLQADVDDLGYDRGHRVLSVVRKGGRRARVPLAPATVDAVEAYLAARGESAGGGAEDVSGPLVATTTGGRLTQAQVWRLVRRLARRAGIRSWAALSPHSLRHTAITAALDAGAGLRDVQDFAGHRDARVTRRYDHTRDSLDRNPTYAVAAWFS